MTSNLFGGMFWDVLLLSEYNDSWNDFFISTTKILPCEICRKENSQYYGDFKNFIPEFKNKDEKDKWVWEHRLQRGGDNWRKKVKDNNWSLDSWKEQFKNKVFSVKEL